VDAAPRTKAAAPGHIPSLDGIRAASFLLVFLGHAVPIRFSHLIPPGFGVTVFFVLSGYLITTLLRMEHDAMGTISFRNFYLRRVLRIWPPFYIVLFVSVILVKAGFLSGGTEPAPVFALAAHVGNYWRIFKGLEGTPGGTSVYWSLAVEEHFYLVFPLFYLAVRKHLPSANRQLAAIVVVCVLVCVWRLVLCTVLDASEDHLAKATDTRLDSILIGCGLAIWANPVLDPPKLTERTMRYLVVPLALLGLFLTFVVKNRVFHDAIKNSIQCLALCPLFVLAMRSPSFGPIRLLNTRIASFLGVLSYTLYLIHRGVLDVLGTAFSAPWYVAMVIALPVSILLAYAMYVFVERPCAELRKRLSPSSSGQSAPRAAHPSVRPAG
jgi:peptidoglycan/LPS O-acetylase OafA/YrhL